MLEREDAQHPKLGVGDQIAYFALWLLAWILGVLLLYLIEPLYTYPGDSLGAARAIGMILLGPIALGVLFWIILMSAALAIGHKRRLRHIHALGVEDFYKAVSRISNQDWTSKTLLMIPAIPVLLIFISVCNDPHRGDMVLIFPIVLGAIMLGLYFLGRAQQKLDMFTDIKLWKRRLAS